MGSSCKSSLTDPQSRPPKNPPVQDRPLQRNVRGDVFDTEGLLSTPQRRYSSPAHLFTTENELIIPRRRSSSMYEAVDRQYKKMGYPTPAAGQDIRGVDTRNVLERRFGLK